MVDLARVDEILTSATAHVEAVPFAFVECESRDGQCLALHAGLLHPVACASFWIGAVSYLRDDAFQAEFTGVFDAEMPPTYSTQQLIQTDTVEMVPEPKNPLPRCFIIVSSGGANGDSEEDGARAQTRPGPGCGRAELRGEVRVQEDGAVSASSQKAVKKVGNRRKRVEKRLGR